MILELLWWLHKLSLLSWKNFILYIVTRVFTHKTVYNYRITLHNQLNQSIIRLINCHKCNFCSSVKSVFTTCFDHHFCFHLLLRPLPSSISFNPLDQSNSRRLRVLLLCCFDHQMLLWPCTEKNCASLTWVLYRRRWRHRSIRIRQRGRGRMRCWGSHCTGCFFVRSVG